MAAFRYTFRSKRWLFCMASVVLLCYVFWRQLFSERCAAVERTKCSASRNRRLEQRKQLKTILLWTSFYGSRTWDFDVLGTAPFKHELCNLRCFATTDRKYLAEADVIVFNYADVDVGDWPENVTGSQLTVLVIEEPPTEVGVKLYQFENRIHFVMSYRRDSDIYAPYRMLKPVSQSVPAYRPRVPLNARNRSVVWISDQCSAPSEREKYVKELSRYIDVDIYGKCGARNCPQPNERCMSMIESTYKFYLAFEDSICKDYVTDHLFQTLKWDVVPVVLGGADYEKEIKSGSPAVINAMDFANPKELAKYLKRLAFDESGYDRLFENKLKYRILDTNGALTGGFCKLCNWLYGKPNPGLFSYRTDLTVWWHIDTCKNDYITEQMRNWQRTSPRQH
ncbi:hypothetical protein LSH36_291g09027 [Paralvinella palmiformis]|uniref:Fucosyltransferase n=1 Tax=Paralvinella palmiformis TaxID=53620 RepID=A0AAD9N1F8_9ANNE|nr:hypothetical protein LSH36_291g09027 [Paralvinella palmiformis]